MLIKEVTGFMPRERAERVAATLRATDPDWTYMVVPCANGMARIDVYDEDKQRVCTGWLPQ